MNTNSKQVKQAVQAYIIGCIDFTGLGYGNESNTLENFVQAFKSEAGKPQRNETYLGFEGANKLVNLKQVKNEND